MPQLLWTSRLTSDGAKSPISFAYRDDGHLTRWNRFLNVNGQDAFHVGNACDTCGFFFERLAGPNCGLELDELRTCLERVADASNAEVLETLAQLLPKSDYTVAILNVCPERVRPLERKDYFALEDVEYQDEFYLVGPPEPHNPATEYYRINGRSGLTIDDSDYTAKAFDFIVPLIPGVALDRERVDHYKDVLVRGQRPTVVALSLLDIKGPNLNDQVHWCLAHYVLDGHHKLAAAAETGSEIGLIAFIAHQHGVSSPEHVARVLDTYSS